MYLLIRNTNKLSFLHLFGDSGLCILRVLSIFQVLLLDLLELVIQLSAGTDGVKFLEQSISGIRGSMHHRVPIGESDREPLPFKELLKVFPVGAFLLQLETVIILVHLDFIGIVS